MPDVSFVAAVIVDVASRQVDKPFDYAVPSILADVVDSGSVVYVPFGRRRAPGYVIGIRPVGLESRPLKPILNVVSAAPPLDEEAIALTAWLTERTACTRLQAIHAVLPSAFRLQTTRVYRGVDEYTPVASLEKECVLLWRKLCRTPRTEMQIVKQFGTTASFWLAELITQGAVVELDSVRTQTGAKTESLVRRKVDVSVLQQALAERLRRAPKQARILQTLLENEEVSVATLLLTPSDASIRALETAGYIERVQVEVLREMTQTGTVEVDTARALTHWQDQACAAIVAACKSGEMHTLLLHGVTGSGKTEVYLQAIDACAVAGRGAVVLVPEIALTPQMVGRFLARFGERVAVLHSGLSAAEKRDEWLRIQRGQATIVVGARSAIFAPLKHPALIIIDEEHETSYKQDESPRYDAREVASWRAQYHGATVVLGSATPSLVSMHQVEQGHAQMLTLPMRVNGRPLPRVTVVDMREELRSGNRSLFSSALAQGVDTALAAAKQSILFLNRRGFAAFALCRSCGETVQCPRCDISLTVHKHAYSSELRCHYCEFTAEWHDVCPNCKEPSLRTFGVGTQQVEAAIQVQWPNARVLRMDVDTTRARGAHQRAISKFLNGEADILVGTQMIAKGLDFPNVTFVGVITADTMLSVPDYRSAERTFQLLTQVAGRAGRAADEGHTVVQTYRPSHFAIAAAAHHDYSAFYREERELRRAFTYPPFCEIAVFVATNQNETLARGAAGRFERELRRAGLDDRLVVLPATASGIPRVEDKYRYQVVVKYEAWSEVRTYVVKAFHLVQAKLDKFGGGCILDVNAGRIG